MPLTVLKISKIIEGQTEVVGEFPNEAEAQRFVDAAKMQAETDGTGADQEYMIEVPPPKIMPSFGALTFKKNTRQENLFFTIIPL